MTKENGINIVKLQVQIEDLKQHLDGKFRDIENIQKRNITDFDYLYKIVNQHSDKLSRHSVYVIIGGTIIAFLIKIIIDIYQKGGF